MKILVIGQAGLEVILDRVWKNQILKQHICAGVRDFLYKNGLIINTMNEKKVF